MEIINGSVVDFIAISWNENQWEFDHPTVVLEPIIKYSPNGESCLGMIEDILIDISCGIQPESDDLKDEFEWRGWNVSRIKKVANNRLCGKDAWKTKIREVVKQNIRFFNLNGTLEFEALETIKA